MVLTPFPLFPEKSQPALYKRQLRGPNVCLSGERLQTLRHNPTHGKARTRERANDSMALSVMLAANDKKGHESACSSL
jgi:hypothetical protein